MRISIHSIFLFCLITALLITSCVNRDTTIQNPDSESGDRTDLKIAFVQLPSRNDPSWNLKVGDEYCRTAKAKGADIVLFPEMVNIGYHSVDFKKATAMEKWTSCAVSRDGPFVKHFQDLARELEMAIVITYLEKTDSLPKNSASLIDRFGDIVITYSKVHTVDPFPMESAVTPGTDFYVADLNTQKGMVKVGIMICYDREFPESARILMLKGAEVILTPNACGLDTMRLIQFRVRAWENAVVTAMANYARTDDTDGYNGHSCAFAADGSTILVAGEEEGLFMASVNLEELREYRSWSYWGNSYRRPHRYGELISPEVKAPFKRNNGFGEPFERLKR